MRSNRFKKKVSEQRDIVVFLYYKFACLHFFTVLNNIRV